LALTAARRTRPAVIKDVARLAGVSAQTVSRVLNQSPQVLPETRERVLDAVERLGYRRNAFARGLSSRRAHTLGVVTVDTGLFGSASTLLSIERTARAHGYGVRIATYAEEDPRSVVEAVELLAEQAIDGVIVIAPHVLSAGALIALPGNIPAVGVETDPVGHIPVVGVDQVAGGRLAAEYLLELGHERVWHLAGPADRLEARHRAEGWRAAMEAAGRWAPAPLSGDWSAASGYRAGLQLLDVAGVTAVFAANDQMALGLMLALQRNGVRVPEDISVVGFDDIPEAEFFLPPLTTVQQNFDLVGRDSVEVLLSTLHGNPPSDVERRPLPPELVVRESTKPPGDPG
jgi:LacI family transcriptional regulator